MKNLRLKKGASNLYRLRKEIDNTIVKVTRNPKSLLEKENKAINDRTIRHSRNLSEYNEDYYKPVKVGYFWSNYIEYEDNSYRNEKLSVEKYLIKLDHT